jgi:hypothetical protein
MRKYWTKEMLEYLKTNYANESSQRIADRFDIKLNAVYNKAFVLGLKKSTEYIEKHCRNLQRSVRNEFAKGHKPWNKGQKGLQIGGLETQFKKGRLPHNTKPIGYRSMRDGYWVERTEKGFEFVHVLIWKQHYGDIPKGLFIVFKDRNQQNLVIENLEVIDRAENMRRNSVQNLPKEILDVIHIKKSITRKINQLEKNGTK